ncbi:SPASM domain-containing protein [bacterium]|nr:SPASM domain-containing protein [bacterium]
MSNCHWPSTTMVILSDLTVVCGCTDPTKKRIVGNLKTQSVSDIWNGEILRNLRNAQGTQKMHPYCVKCHLGACPTHPDCGPRRNEVEAGPQILQIEPCIRCNLRCPTPHCEENNAGGTRDSDLMQLVDFQRIIEEVGTDLEVVRFYNYGESFLNKEVYEMISFLRKTHPDVFIDAHTNGLAFNSPQEIKSLIQSSLDYLVVSIDGAFQESYEKYRRRGNLKKVLDNVAQIVALRNKLNLDRPYICWRYILFNWNDSDEEMALALKTAREIGVDQLVWVMNGADPGFSSKRFAHGTELLESIKKYTWDFGGAGANALLQGMDYSEPGRLHDLANIQSETEQIQCFSGDQIHLDVCVTNVGTMTWRVGFCDFQRGSARPGFFLFKKGSSIPWVEGRAKALTRDIFPGESENIHFTIIAPEDPGEYVLKMDMVCELRYWFSDNGSQPLEIPFIVSKKSKTNKILRMFSGLFNRT